MPNQVSAATRRARAKPERRLLLRHRHGPGLLTKAGCFITLSSHDIVIRLF